MSKKKVTKKEDPKVVTRRETDAEGKVVEEVKMSREQAFEEMFDERANELREKLVVFHGLQGGLLAALGLASELGQRGASAETIARSIDALHDDWLGRMDAAHDELAIHTMMSTDDVAPLPCLHCGGPTENCQGDQCHHDSHEGDADDE